MILRYTDPEARVVLIDGNKMTMTWPSRNLNQAIDIAATQGRIQKYFVNGSAGDLRRQFDIDDRPPGDGRPKSNTCRRSRSASRLPKGYPPRTVGRPHVEPVETMKMTFPNGDSKTMAFEDVVPNPPLDASTFNIDR